MTAQHITLDIPEKILLAEKTDALAFGRELRVLAAAISNTSPLLYLYLIRMQSGTFAYLTRRIDRSKIEKLHIEDMCQITGRLTEDKYHGSYEQIAKAIQRYSVNPGLDVINFFEMVLFCFLTGNADMHLKNFSLLDVPVRGYSLELAIFSWTV